jgi:uncharacterized membrane protein
MHISSNPVMAALKIRFPAFIWSFLGIFLIGYGVIAFNAGSHVTPALDNQAPTLLTNIMKQADDGVDMSHSPEADYMPYWMNFIAKIESSKYIYGSDSVTTTQQHYQTLSEPKRYVISTHMAVGSILMVAGFFQFLPAFRRKHRKLHRIFGVVYVLSAFISTGLSGYYLATTDVSDIYQEFVFATGLWFVLVIAVVGISVSSYAIFKRNIALHLGWQTLAFGSFLTAPIQRSLWVGLAPFSDGASFNEMDILTGTILFGLSFMLAYWIFYANRQSSPLRASSIPSISDAMAPSSKYGIYIGLAVAWLLMTIFYVLFPGLAGSVFTKNFAYESAIQWHDKNLGTILPSVLIVLMASFLTAAVRVLMVSPMAIEGMSLEKKIFFSSGIGISAIFILWGYRLGMPSYVHSIAGVFYTYLGVFILAFLGLILRAITTREIGKIKEWLVFIILLAISPAVVYMTLFINDTVDFIPQAYRHQGYEMSAGLAIALTSIFGHLFAIYSAETKRYIIN